MVVETVAPPATPDRVLDLHQVVTVVIDSSVIALEPGVAAALKYATKDGRMTLESLTDAIDRKI